jgi:hypothetical protein
MFSLENANFHETDAIKKGFSVMMLGESRKLKNLCKKCKAPSIFPLHETSWEQFITAD